MPNNPYEWHVWHMPPNGPRRYVGAFRTPEEGMAWKKKQANPAEYRVTNVGPLGMGWQQTPSVKTPPSQPSSAVRRSMAEARKEAVRRDRERAQQRAEDKRKKAERDAENLKVTAKMREEAAGLLEGHKAEEAADLEAGINR